MTAHSCSFPQVRGDVYVHNQNGYSLTVHVLGHNKQYTHKHPSDGCAESLGSGSTEPED